MSEMDKLHALRLAARAIHNLKLPANHRAWLLNQLI